MKRRIFFGLLVVALLVAAKLLFVRPVETRLELAFGANSPSVRRVALVFTDGAGHVQRELELGYPSGAPASDTRTVKLKPGDYTIGARLELAVEPPRTFDRPLHVEESGSYPVDLSH